MKQPKRVKLPKPLPLNELENEIVDGLEDFSDALENGQVSERLTCREIRLNLAPREYGPDRVRATRELLKLSQALFAHLLGVSVQTVRAWEQGVNVPNKMASRFMDEIGRDPKYWHRRLRQATVSNGRK